MARAAVYGRQSRGKAKSIADQVAACTADVREQGWELNAAYQDGTSASRYATKRRGGWEAVLADLEAGAWDVLVLWEPSRGDREAETWLGLLRRCRERGVLIRVTSHHRTYDMKRNARDWRTLAEDGIDSAWESDKLSERVQRGVDSAAASGRPPMGRAPYGYRRAYDPTTGALVGQEPEPTQAAIVCEVVAAVAKGVPLIRIMNDLNERGVPAPAGGRWRRLALRTMCLNAAYIGQREHRGTAYEAQWPPLVDRETFYAARRILTEPARLVQGSHSRPGKQKHLLTYLAVCACGAPISAHGVYYVCRGRGCISVRRSAVDELITDLVLGRLSQEDVYEALQQVGEQDDAELLAAREEIATLRERLRSFRGSAAKGQTSPESLAFMEAEITPQIKAAEARERAAGLPPEVRDLLEPGEDVRTRWTHPDHPLAAKRTVVRFLMQVTIKPTPGGRNAYAPVHQRVDVDWVKNASAKS